MRRAARARKWISGLRRWPVHPQWLLDSARGERDIADALSGMHGLVLDIGCAGGRLARYLPADAVYVGLDFPGTATALYATKPDIFANASALPLLDRCIDGVILKDVLEHVREPERALSEAARVLRPGGRLVLWMPFMYPIHDLPHDFQRYTEHALAAHLEERGFKVHGLSAVCTPIETAALLGCLALADAAEQVMLGRRIFLPILPLLGGLIVVVNIVGRSLRWLPATRFMPASYRVLAEFTGK